MAKISIIEFMAFKGFDYLYVDFSQSRPGFMFIDTEEDIIVKVYQDEQYEFIYTNKQMNGFLTSGEHENIYNVQDFTKRYNAFIETVNKMKEIFCEEIL